MAVDKYLLKKYKTNFLFRYSDQEYSKDLAQNFKHCQMQRLRYHFGVNTKITENEVHRYILQPSRNLVECMNLYWTEFPSRRKMNKTGMMISKLSKFILALF